MKTDEEMEADSAFVARIRLSVDPPECPRCGQPGEWVHHGEPVASQVTHWACSCPFCKWEAMLGMDFFLVGIPKRANEWDLWGDPSDTRRSLPFPQSATPRRRKPG